MKMKCNGDSEILHEIVLDPTRKSEKHEPIRVVLHHELCCEVRISESPLHFISFLIVKQKISVFIFILQFLTRTNQ